MTHNCKPEAAGSEDVGLIGLVSRQCRTVSNDTYQQLTTCHWQCRILMLVRGSRQDLQHMHS
jgi:hypothetical protein